MPEHQHIVTLSLLCNGTASDWQSSCLSLPKAVTAGSWLYLKLDLTYLIFPVAVMKPSDDINLKKKGFILVRMWRICSTATWSSSSHSIHIQEEENGECLCSVHFLLFTQFIIPAQGMMQPTMGRTSHPNRCHQSSLPQVYIQRPIFKAALFIQPIIEINHHSTLFMLILDSGMTTAYDLSFCYIISYLQSNKHKS